MPTEITAEFEIITPMFLGDASSDQLADTIRPPSIKGALRFWWRALAWSRLAAEEKDEQEILRQLHTEEAQLFGAAHDPNKQTRQARFTLQVQKSDDPEWKRVISNWPAKNTGSGYLGLGLFESGSRERGNYQPQRHALPEGLHFFVTLRLHPRIKPKQIEQLKQALACFGYLGGLGGRGQRRGYGSVALITLNEEDHAFNDVAGYLKQVKTLLKTPSDIPNPSYSAISPSTQFIHLSTKPNARGAHNEMGQIYKDFRGVSSNLRGRTKIGFGLPLKDVDEDARRASPVLFHVHRIGSEYSGFALYLPTTTFHPAYPHPNMKPVEDFLRKGMHS